MKYSFTDLKPYIYGFPWLDETWPKLLRFPHRISKDLSWSIRRLSKDTSGGRIRFTSGLNKITIKAYMGLNLKPEFQFRIRQSGLDLYVDGKFWGQIEASTTIRHKFTFPWVEGEEHSFEIYFPFYNRLKKISITANREIQPAARYNRSDPIVYYGSSITQGASAARSGLAYPAMVSRHLKTDFVNLGFSGNGLGEAEVARALSEISASVYVMDFGINMTKLDEAVFAPRYIEFLRILRKNHPITPIVLVNMQHWKDEAVDPNLLARIDRCRQVIRDQYSFYKGQGDLNIYLIAMERIFTLDDFDATLDGAHPNTHGMVLYAKELIPVLEKIIR